MATWAVCSFPPAAQLGLWIFPALSKVREARASHRQNLPGAKRQSRATVRSSAAVVTLDGGGSGGNRILSTDTVTPRLRVFMRLPSYGRLLDLMRWRC